jgi:hypothetical protein
MKYVSQIVITFAPKMLPGTCGRNRMALTSRRERTIEGVTP